MMMRTLANCVAVTDATHLKPKKYIAGVDMADAEEPKIDENADNTPMIMAVARR